MSACPDPDLAGGAAVPACARGGPVSHAIFRVARLHRMYVGQLLRRVGLHPGQELVMMQLWERGPQRQADLVRLLDSDAATMTRTIQRLEHAGFVRRCPCANDKRASYIEPTAASLALRREVENIWTELEDKTLGDLSAAERTETLRVLERIEGNLTRATTQDG
ncbi:MarR family winged helix-turn-helix transcriptional regulator [Couchioplanes caeruleus]|uniref:Transcriptional regulator n=2 Tax=Couchioplanes caeruleus TaxID=56438 RepID=A0A1K0GMX8_9ACTN|nr:MarR family winged helix-turn-helix transcriptional regulator [Couchioplanes caeruleus]OJF10555.1 transcriptional regulator [Couchioplanes caeruleus subsp. caeruleus]ROP28650.1 DNA-binding MarR family transcriptional regulator [Couchioplanes caeruleus]